jgi:glycosyltransferase involved in cell wall biosynthesis
VGDPRVSVVVLHHDRRRCLRQALESIAAQAWRGFEVIVVSDAGPESSRVLVDGFAAAHAGAFDVRWVGRAGNGGVAAARNTGVAAARGALVAFLDDDDRWRPGHLGALARASAPDRIAYGDAEVQRMEPAGEGSGRAADGDLDPSLWRVVDRAPLAVPFAADDLRRDDFIVPGGMLVARETLARVGPFDESIFVSDDWDWLLRALAVLGPAAFVRVPETVVDVRIWSGAAAAANLSATFDERRRAALDTLERRHGTPRLEPKTFWEVAGTYAARRAT